MSATATFPHATATPLVAREADFPDWMNPMLVKELRQGLRGRWFMVVFLWVQLSMVGLVAAQFLFVPPNSDYIARAMFEGLYYTNVVLILHVLIPFRGVLMRDQDLDEGNLQLLRMTGSEVRISKSKVQTSCFMALLCAVAILPYAVLRYYTVGVEIVREVVTLAWLMAGSCILAVWGLFLSVLGVVGRIIMGGLIIFIGFPVLEYGVWATIMATTRSPSLGVFFSTAIFWFIAVLVLGLAPFSMASAKFYSGRMMDPGPPQVPL